MNKLFKFFLHAGLLLAFSFVYAQTDESSAGGVGVILRDLLVTGSLISGSLIGAFGALVPRLGLGVAVESLLVRSVGSLTLPTNPAAVGLTIIGMVLSFGILYEAGADESFLVGVPAAHEETKVFRESVNNLFADEVSSPAESVDSGDSTVPVTAPSGSSGSGAGGGSGSGDSTASNPVPVIEEVFNKPYLPQVPPDVIGIGGGYAGGADERKVSYDDALAKAKKIADDITAQITAKFPEAKSVTDVVSPIIAEMFAREFSDGTFYSNTFESLKKKILDIITAEINKQYTDPNIRQQALGIGDQIATQMTEQFLANPNLDSVKLTLVAKRNRLVYDQDVLDVIAGLKKVQNDPDRITPYMFSGSVAGEWEGTLKAPAFEGCSAVNSTWNGFWYESDQTSSVPDQIRGNFYEVTGSFGGTQNPFSRTGGGYARITGEHYLQTKNSVNLEFRLYANEINGFKKSIFTGNVISQNPVSGSLYDNTVSGSFLSVCPTNPEVGTSGTFTGRRLVSDMTGPWSGVSTVKEPTACAATNSWTAQLSEFQGDVFGFFTQGSEKYEARGIYDKASKEAIWIAGDYAFLGLVNNGKMTGTMLGPDCAGGTNSAGGKEQQGTFSADLGMRNIKYSLPTPVQQLKPTDDAPISETQSDQILQREGTLNLPSHN